MKCGFIQEKLQRNLPVRARVEAGILGNINVGIFDRGEGVRAGGGEPQIPAGMAP